VSDEEKITRKSENADSEVENEEFEIAPSNIRKNNEADKSDEISMFENLFEVSMNENKDTESKSEPNVLVSNKHDAIELTLEDNQKRSELEMNDDDEAANDENRSEPMTDEALEITEEEEEGEVENRSAEKVTDIERNKLKNVRSELGIDAASLQHEINRYNLRKRIKKKRDQQFDSKYYNYLNFATNARSRKRRVSQINEKMCKKLVLEEVSKM